MTAISRQFQAVNLPVYNWEEYWSLVPAIPVSLRVVPAITASRRVIPAARRMVPGVAAALRVVPAIPAALRVVPEIPASLRVVPVIPAPLLGLRRAWPVWVQRPVSLEDLAAVFQPRDP